MERVGVVGGSVVRSRSSFSSVGVVEVVKNDEK